VAGLSLLRALDECSGRTPATFSLKWPNDVLACGAKLAGILLEAESRPDGSRFVLVGIGVNVAAAPHGLDYPASSLAALGLGIDAASLFAALSAEWARAYAAWDEGRGFGAIRRAWLERATGLGRKITIRAAGRDVAAGTFETLDEDGRLVMRLQDGGTQRVSAGEVHFGDAATVRSEAVA
jgi:BirA family biotin operon repressor/biotin-[acetyl-CoA-carboxylase] ligase